MRDSDKTLLTTPLDALHRELGAKMVPFAGYDMPVQYPMGVLKEHLHTRENAGLFDVSHMGQAYLMGDGAIEAFEALVPGDYQILPVGTTRYTVLLNDKGTIMDDLMATRIEGGLYIVVNAACKDADFAHIREKTAGKAELEILDDRALMAIQGPKAAAVVERLSPETADMTFMMFRQITIAGIPCFATRSGYTGEDGFEISVPAHKAEELARALLAEPEVEAIGLGARDSLRLEAGLCLYGHDIDTGTTPAEADLKWVVNKRRRAEKGFPGADIILDQIVEGTERLRVGIKPEDRTIAREGTEIQNMDGNIIGQLTSGGFGPSVDGPVAMGYVQTEYSIEDTRVYLIVRGKIVSARVVKTPFTPHRYRIKKKS